MKKWLLHIWMMGVLGMLAASCSQDADDPTQTESRAEKLQVYFTLDLGENGMDSRTTWEDYDNNNTSPAQKGTDAENIVNDIQVLLFSNTDNAFLGEVSITAFYPTEGDSHLYKFFGELPTLPTGTSVMDADKYLNCKLMVLANCSVDPSQINGTTTINSLLEAATFNFNGSPSEIPMWGVLKVVPGLDANGNKTGVKMQEGGFPNPLPDIYLLRAMAKVEVIMQAEDHEITYIALNRYNQTGNNVPSNYATVSDTRLLVRNDAFRATSSVNTGLVPFIGNESTTADGGYKCYTIYVPEYDNTGDGVTASCIDIQVDGNTGKTYKVYYGANGKSTDYNIVRNHIYRFNITGVKTGELLDLKLIVNPWNVDEENIQFTNEVTVSEKMQWEGTYITPNTTDGSILYINGSINAATATTVTFQIDTPIGATWYASFEGDKDAFAFLDNQGNEVTSVTGEVGTPATLKIVTTEEHVAEMKSVSLMIVVRTMDGRTIMVNKDLMPESLNTKDYYQIRQNLSI